MSANFSGLRIAGFPGRYVQGPGALASLGGVLAELGARRVATVTDDVVEAVVGSRVSASLASHDLAHVRLPFAGECTRDAIDALAGAAERAGVDAVVGIGGGKALDTAKGIARERRALLATVPTVASNDSPTSRLIVLYDEAHRVLGVEQLARNPDFVLVDTAVIVQAPVRFFRAGVGDALSKRFEAAQCRDSGGLNFFGGRPPETAGLLAGHCYAVLCAHAETAIADVSAQRVTPAVETVTEATVLLSGLGFESGGLSIAHSLLRGFTAVPALNGSLHGELVAFGTLVQLVLEGRPAAELRSHAALLRRLGLPGTLAALGQPALDAAELATVGTLTAQAPYAKNFTQAIDAGAIARAVVDADRIGAGAR